jgi:integrase/recombinase XerD
MAKMKMKNVSPTIEETMDSFINSRKAKGLTDKTIRTYHYHFQAIRKFLDLSKEIDTLTKRDLEKMIAEMRSAGLASNSINSYTRTLKSFFSWCNEEGITELNISLYKAEETVKATYTDNELKRLLKRPNVRSCGFTEYRNWVIINLLLNSGCRAATIRNMLIQDVNLSNATITYRHTKNKSIQIVPLCSTMVNILREYLRVRDGKPQDYLFPNENGKMLTESGLQQAIEHYNKSRGVEEVEKDVRIHKGMALET